MQSGAEAPMETPGKDSGFFKAFEGSGGDVGRLEVSWETIQITMYAKIGEYIKGLTWPRNSLWKKKAGPIKDGQ